jgi:hypothetical protein
MKHNPSNDRAIYLARMQDAGNQAAADMRAIARGHDQHGPYSVAELNYIEDTAIICAQLAVQYARLAGKWTA